MKMQTITKRSIYPFMAFCAAVFCITGCYYDKGELLYPGGNAPVDCATTSAKFSANVLPLITTKCAISGCHNNSAAGGVVLLNYAQIKAASARIKVRAVDEKTMPEGAPLAAAEVAILKCWIEAGAPNN